MAGKYSKYITLVIITILMASCENPFGPKKTNWNVSLKKDDKKPYGSYLAYNSLKHYFPDAEIEVLSSGFRYTNIDAKMYYDSKGTSLLILLGLDFYLSPAELEELVYFANYGNEVILFCSRLDDTIAQRLNCTKYMLGQEEYRPYSHDDANANKGILTLNTPNSPSYGYYGRSLESYFSINSDSSKVDSTDNGNVALTSDSGNVIKFDESENDAVIPTTEGYTEAESNAVTEETEDYEEPDDGEDEIIISKPEILGFAHKSPDYIRYKIGAGHITLHAAPLVLSNYFLLQGNNKNYLDAIWHNFPDDISHIYWNEYYKRHAQSSDFSVLWRYPATRWALIIALFTLLMYVLFESKRRQKIIPVIEQPENASLSFTETVGRLYYNKGNHANIAEKMIQHFLEWVRSNYLLNTNHLNYEFIQHLSKKTGETEQTVSRLVEMIHEIRIGNIQPDEPYLYELYSTIQRFYKNNEH